MRKWSSLLVIVVALGVLSGGCADLTIDEAFAIFEEFQPQADPCRSWDSECAASQATMEIRKTKESDKLRSDAVDTMKDDPESARESIDDAIDLRPLDVGNRRTRITFDVIEGREPSRIDLLVLGANRDPAEVQLDLVRTFGLILTGEVEAVNTGNPEGLVPVDSDGWTNLKAAFCKALDAADGNPSRTKEQEAELKPYRQLASNRSWCPGR